MSAFRRQREARLGRSPLLAPCVAAVLVLAASASGVLGGSEQAGVHSGAPLLGMSGMPLPTPKGPTPPSGSSPCTYIPGSSTGTC
jgi:hypothetical protein